MKGIFPEGTARMNLGEHLTELRRRLIRFLSVAGVLGLLGLFFAKPLFALLMQPVLAALPPDARGLIYTSGIEEVNVLLKVGLYAGVFGGTPVLLWQVWGFVSPGLLPEERRYAAPFVAGGTLAFLLGTAFCYFAILPATFSFLLAGEGARPLQERLDASDAAHREAMRYLRLGALGPATQWAQRASTTLGASGDGAIAPPSRGARLAAKDVAQRLEALGEWVDQAQNLGPGLYPVLVQVLERRGAAQRALDESRTSDAAQQTEDAVALLLGGAVGEQRDALQALWQLSVQRVVGRATLAKLSWTRPMLTMHEQLSLVLVLEIAFGVIFELPLVIALLAALGVVSSATLFRYQRHAAVGALILAAVLTPTGDVVNLLLMTVPLVVCYELGALAAWLIERRRARGTLAPSQEL